MQPDEEINFELEILIRAKQAKATVEHLIEESTAKLVKIAEQSQSKTLEGTVDDQKYTITVVAAERVVYDEDGLRDELGAKQWARVTTAKIDSAKLKSEMTTGRISPAVVGQHCSIKKSQPYVKISESK